MISKVGKFHVGQMVLYDGKVCKIAGFKNRNTAFLDNLDSDSTWTGGRASLKDVMVPKFVPEGILPDVFRRFVADAVERGFRESGFACKVNICGDELKVFFAAHRPAPFIKMTVERVKPW